LTFRPLDPPALKLLTSLYKLRKTGRRAGLPTFAPSDFPIFDPRFRRGKLLTIKKCNWQYALPVSSWENHDESDKGESGTQQAG